MNAPTRKRAEQKYVVVLPDGTVVGTVAGLPFTRDGAWLYERELRESGTDAHAVKIAPRGENTDG